LQERSQVLSTGTCLEVSSNLFIAHHLHITIDDAVGDVFNFCKPVAKVHPVDSTFLSPHLHVILTNGLDTRGSLGFNQGSYRRLRQILFRFVLLLRFDACIHTYLLLGSDSAPHPVQSKKGAGATAAGCFTQPYVSQIVIEALEEAIEQGWISESELTVEALEGFLSVFGRKFYKLPPPSQTKKIRLEKKGEKISPIVRSADGAVEVVPWGRGREIRSLSWV
jgi:dihydroorotase